MLIAMFFLQTSPIEIGFGGALLLNTALLLRITFYAGKMDQKVEDHGDRLDKIEAKDVCTKDDCPVRNR
jgi:hypothetical protein